MGRLRCWKGFVLCLVWLSAVAGCGQERLVKVSGQATVDGKPLTNAAIFFAPDKGNPLKEIPWRALDDNGHYELFTGKNEGAPLGWYKVYVGFQTLLIKGDATTVHPRYQDDVHTPLSIEVVANPQPGAYDLKFTKD